MLVEFRVENFRSLRDEQAITFESQRGGDQDDTRPRKVAGHKAKLLPASVIYGANASGKSNVLLGLSFMRDAVIYSHREWDPEGGVPRTPFAWGGKRSDPSLFETTFLIEGTKYVYGFVVDDEDVLEEWLFAWPNNHKQVWFERDANTFKFGEKLRGPNEAAIEVTRPNALFISAAVQQSHKQLMPIYSWFRRILTMNSHENRNPLLTRRMFSRRIIRPTPIQRTLFPLEEEAEEKLLEQIRQLLKVSDIGIVDIKTIDTEGEYKGRSFQRQQIYLQHQLGDEDSWLELREESEGTKTLYHMAPSIFWVLNSGGLLVIDELESSLHPLLGLAILNLFNNPESNAKNAQILFTTHDTNLLGTTLGASPLRRDQIWFTEKNKEGASQLYPLTNYKPRKAENLERGYLQGRYGAIPFLADISQIPE